MGGKGHVVGEQRGYQSRQHHIKLVLNEVCFAERLAWSPCSSTIGPCINVFDGEG